MIKIESVKESFHGQEPWFNVFLYKILTVPTTYFIVRYTKISPNQLTLASFVFALISGVLYLNGFMELGAIGYLVSYLCDAIDGKVSRIKKLTTRYGAWLDIAFDRINIAFVASCLSIYYYNQALDSEFMILNFLFLFLFMFGFESRYNIQLNQLQEKIANGTAEKYLIEGWRVGVGSDDDRVNRKWLVKYKAWCRNKGVITQPISLVELLIFQLAVSPVIGCYSYAVILSIAFLIVRLLVQQYYWLTAE